MYLMHRTVPFACTLYGIPYRLRTGIAFAKLVTCCRVSVKAMIHSLNDSLIHSCPQDRIPFSKNISDKKLEPFKVCKYNNDMTCNDCGIKMQRRHLHTQQTTNCPLRTKCEHCGEDIIVSFEVMHKYQQCKNFHDKQDQLPHEEEELIRGGKDRKYQTDLQKKENLMKTKTAEAVMSLRTAANYLDEKWKEYNKYHYRFTWRLCACTSVGAIIASMLHHPNAANIIWVLGVLYVVNYPKLGKDVGEAIYSISSEIPKAEKHFNEAERAVKEVKDTIQFWKKSPTLAKKLCNSHEDILQQADNVPITKRQAGASTGTQAAAALLSGDVHYSIRDIATNWGVGASRILREKADELNKFTKPQ